MLSTPSLHLSPSPRRNLIAFASRFALSSCALLGLGSTAHATESGLGFYQTASIYPKGNFHFDYDTLGQGVKTNLGTSVGLEYGLGPDRDGLFGRTEVGFDYQTSGSAGNPFPSSASDRISFNIKTQLYNNDAEGTRVSMGVSGLGRRVNFASANIHLLGYKDFSFGRVHAGLFKNIRRRDGGNNSAGVQLGFSKAIQNGKFVVGADWRSGSTGFLAPCLIYNFNKKADVEIALGRANDSSVSPRYQTYIAFDYNFGRN